VLRVVDEGSRAPVAQALVTLRADNSAHRRAGLTDVPTHGDGQVELVHVVPGRYELTVARGESQHQEMIELHPKERRDLGDIALGMAAGLDVLVVDERGNPAQAWLEIGAYGKDARNGDLYPQMLHHATEARDGARL